MAAGKKSRVRHSQLTHLELAQRRRTLAIVLWIIFAAALALAFINLSIPAIPETIALFGTAVLCIPALLLNSRGHYLAASAIATILVLAAVIFNMYQGHGVHDTAVVSVPLLVLLGPLLYGRRSVLLFLALGIASIVVIAGLEMNGIITTAMPASFADVAGLSVLVACAGTLVWVIVSNLEGNLRRARQSEAELRTAYDRTLESLASALAYRDWETQDHARRVVDLCVRLAKEWGLKDEQLRHIRRGALLHDIGKLAVPDRILLKPGPLSQDEWKTMRRHTAYAGRMLAGIPYLRPALAIPLSHHECWDGTGYPQRLKGRQIPVQARLFAIVDQYDALTSPRPYRKAWSKRRAIEHIKANSGRIFDPAVVSLFLRLYEQGELGRGN